MEEATVVSLDFFTLHNSKPCCTLHVGLVEKPEAHETNQILDITKRISLKDQLKRYLLGGDYVPRVAKTDS